MRQETLEPVLTIRLFCVPSSASGVVVFGLEVKKHLKGESCCWLGLGVGEGLSSPQIMDGMKCQGFNGRDCSTFPSKPSECGGLCPQMWVPAANRLLFALLNPEVCAAERGLG